MDGPGAEVFVGVAEQGEEKVLIGGLDGVEGPEGAEAEPGRAGGVEFLAQSRGGGRAELSAVGAFLQHAPAMADREFLRVADGGDKGLVRETREVDPGDGLIAVDDFVDAPVASVVSVLAIVVALVFVVPVDDEHGAVLVVELVEGLAPGIVEIEEIGGVATDEAGAAAFGKVHVEPLAVDIADEHFVVVLGWPGASEVDHQTGVGVAATDGVATGVGRVGAFGARPVDVVAVGFDVVVDEWVDVGGCAFGQVWTAAGGFLGGDGEVLAALTFVAGALDDVPEVGDDAGFLEELTEIVVIQTPGVAGALGEDFVLVTGWVIAPYGAVGSLALGLGRAGFSDEGGAEDAVATVEPAIRSPPERVERFVGVGLKIPAIEENARVAGGFGRVPVVDRNEEEVGGGADPDTAEADFEAAHQVDPFEEHGAFIEVVVAVGVLEHEDSVAAAEDIGELRGGGLGEVGPWRAGFGGGATAALGVGETLGDPCAPPVVEAEGDGLDDVRFGREDVGLEALGQGHGLGCIGGADAREPDHVGGGIVGRGRVGGPDPGPCEEEGRGESEPSVQCPGPGGSRG